MAVSLGRRLRRSGLEVAVRIDLFRSLGPREAWRRRRDDARAAALPAGNLRPGYRRLWLDAARSVGAEANELGEGFVELRRGGRAVRVWNSWVPLDDAVTLRLADNKRLARQALVGGGLPVPAYVRFTLDDRSPAIDFLARADEPCVVKPVDSAGGSGATTGVRTPSGLRRACLRAGRLSPELLIERQVPGDLYRLLFLEGELLDVIRRLPPRVTGDGRSTIAELVRKENEGRFVAAGGERPGLLQLDLDAILTLEHAGLRPSSMPRAGEVVTVKTVVNQNGPEDNSTARDAVCDELVEEATRAVEAIGVKLAGVDLITTDPGRPLRESGGAILEVNGTPGLHYHYGVANPDRAVPVAVPILERLLQRADQ